MAVTTTGNENLDLFMYLFIYVFIYLFTITQQPPPPGSLNLLIIEDSQSHSDTPHSVEFLWTSDQLVAENSTRTTQQSSMPLVGFEPTISAGECLRPRDYWDRPSYSAYPV